MPTALCSKADCGKPVHGRGLCSTHYAQVRRAGLLPPPPTQEERFWAFVDRSAGPDACWPWTGASSELGYGRFDNNTKAPRFAWQITNGPIPAGQVIRHGCDYPPCVNPAHLSLGTQKQNVGDMIERGRAWWQGMTHCKRGHEYTPENSMPIPGNDRWKRCRECHRMHSRARALWKRAA